MPKDPFAEYYVDDDPFEEYYTDEEEEQQSALSRAWEWGRTPLTTAPTRVAQSIGQQYFPEATGENYLLDVGRGFYRGALEGAGELLSGMTAPIDLAATLATGGAGIAGKAGLPAAAKGLHAASQALSLPVVGSGAQRLYQAESPVDVGHGLLEVAGGIAGTLPLHVPKAPVYSPTSKRLTKGDLFNQPPPEPGRPLGLPPAPGKPIQAGPNEPIVISPQDRNSNYYGRLRKNLEAQGYTRGARLPDGSEQWTPPFRPNATELPQDVGYTYQYPGADIPPGGRPSPKIEELPPSLAEQPPAARIPDEVLPPTTDTGIGPKIAPPPDTLTSPSQHPLATVNAKKLKRIYQLVQRRPETLTKREQNELSKLLGELNSEQIDVLLKETGQIPSTSSAPKTSGPIAGAVARMMGMVPESGIADIAENIIPPNPQLDLPAAPRPDPIISPFTNQIVDPTISAARSGRPPNHPGSRNPNVYQGEGPRAGVLAKLNQAISQARVLRAEQDAIYSQERARRFGEFRKVKTEGEVGAREAIGKLSGPHEKVTFESIRGTQSRGQGGKFSKGVVLNQQDIDTLFDIVKQATGFTEGEKAHAFQGLWKMLGEYGGHVPQPNELNTLTKVFNQTFGRAHSQAFVDAISMHTPNSFRAKPISTLGNEMKTIMSSTDISAPLTAGLPFIRHGAWWRAWGPMIKSMFSSNYYDALNESIRNNQYFKQGANSGLSLPDILSGKEEKFAGSYVKRVPGLGNIVRGSERAYTGFLNKLRMDVYSKLMDEARWAFGDEVLDNYVFTGALADYVNTSTGRGSLGSWAGAANKLNAHFFAPRRIASRMRMLNVSYYQINPGKLTPFDFTPEGHFVRMEKIKTMLGLASLGIGVSSLGWAAGRYGGLPVNVSFDPNNADFLKLRVGDTRLDYLGGFQQYVVLASRLWSGERASSINPRRSIELGSRYGYPSKFDVAMEFLIQKASPDTSLGIRALKQKGPQGEPIDWAREWRSRLLPILINDLWELYEDNPSMAAWFFTPLFGAVGVNVQTYGRQRPKVYNPEGGSFIQF